MRTLLREPGAGVMHSLIYFSFLILLGVTTTLEVDHQLPDGLKFLHGDVYRAYSAVGDAAGLVFVTGMVWAILRRFGPPAWRPYRIRIKTRPEHAVIGGVLLAIGVTGFGAEAFRIAADGLPDHERWSFIGYPLATLVDGSGAVAGWHQAWWVAHVIAFVAFLVDPAHHHAAPHVHIAAEHVPAPPRPSQGRNAPHARPGGGRHRARDVRGLGGRGLLVEAAARHRRLHHVRPLHIGVPGPCHRQAPRSPRDRPQDGEVMARTGSPPTSPPLGTGEAEVKVPANWMFERISTEELWACTSCRACDEICPVNIEILDKILDMRRYLTLMESDFPSELGQAFRGMENSSNRGR